MSDKVERSLPFRFLRFRRLIARRSRRFHSYRKLAVAIAIGYLVAAAIYTAVTAILFASGHGHWSFQEAALPRLNDVVVFTFFAVCGASVGSFLNVVVWRMPQGLSVNGHSFCPRCRNTLRVRDNVPIFGWLWLGGRCRDCRLPISSRYPIVEAAVAMTFACIGTLELYGWNLPYHPSPFRSGMLTPMVSTYSIVPVTYHLVGLAIAWAMGLIRYDRNGIPARLVYFAAAWLMIGMILVPALASVPWQLTLPEGWYTLINGEPRARHSTPAHLGEAILQNLANVPLLINTLVRILTALVAACFFARVMARALCPQANLKTDPLSNHTQRLVDLVMMIAVVALTVGWQSTSGVLIAASLFACVAGRWFGPDRTDAMGRFSLCLPVALALQVLFWRPLMDSGFWPSAPTLAGSNRGVILGFAMATLCIPLWLRQSASPESQNASAEPESPSPLHPSDSDSDPDE